MTLTDLRQLGLKFPEKYIAAETFAEIPVPAGDTEG